MLNRGSDSVAHNFGRQHEGRQPGAAVGPFGLCVCPVIMELARTPSMVEATAPTLDLSLRTPYAADAFTMMQEAPDAYRAVVADCPEPFTCCLGGGREILRSFEASTTGLVASGEVLVASEAKPQLRSQLSETF